MALKATVFKVQLNISDIDRSYYHTHHLTVAQHPSETNQRMMVRLIAFALNASESLTFTKGLSSDDDEAELWDKDLSGNINLWIEFGQSDEKWLRKACGRSKYVQLFCYGGRSVPIWWQQNQKAFERYKNLKVWEIAESTVEQLDQFVERNMDLQFNICEGQVWLSNALTSILIEPTILKMFED